MLPPTNKFRNRCSSDIQQIDTINHQDSSQLTPTQTIDQIKLQKQENQNPFFSPHSASLLRRSRYLKKNRKPALQDIPQKVQIQKPQLKQEQKIQVPKYTQCPICAELVLNHEIVAFSENCIHFSCNLCIQQHIQQQLKDFKIIKCFDTTCAETVTENSSVYNFVMSVQQKEKYYKILIYNSVNNTQNQKLCPKEACPGYMLIDQRPVICIVCNQQFCEKCLFIKHAGQCDQNGIKFLEKDLLFKKCEKCKMIVEKNNGCNHMTCRCGYQFCYVCGVIWENNHKCGVSQVGPQFRDDRSLINMRLQNVYRRNIPIEQIRELQILALPDVLPEISIRANARPRLQQPNLNLSMEQTRPPLNQQAREVVREQQIQQQQQGLLYKFFVDTLAISVLPLDIALFAIFHITVLLFGVLIFLKSVFYSSIIFTGNRFCNLPRQRCEKCKQIILLVLIVPAWFCCFLEELDKYGIQLVKTYFQKFNLPFCLYRKVKNALRQ